MTKLFGPYKKRSRTASMQLSINAIVILVMAMAVLGLGLGLIRGVLGSGKDKLMGSLEEMDLTEPATAEKPITNINSVELKYNKENEFVIGFYNAQFDGCEDEAKVNLTCSNEDLELTQDPIVLKVQQGESRKLGSIITPIAVDPAKKTYGCTVSVQCKKDVEGSTWEDVTSESAFIKVLS